jgi:hypothetical protein
MTWRFTLLLLGAGLVWSGPAPGQSLSNSAVQGNYGFRVSGHIDPAAADALGTGTSLAASGVFAADGKGNITAGSITYYAAANGNACSSKLAPTAGLGGSGYAVESDGEAFLNLQLQSVTKACPFISLGFGMAVDVLDASGIAHHLELAGAAVGFGSETFEAIILHGEANFQQPASLRFITPPGCIVSQRC